MSYYIPIMHTHTIRFIKSPFYIIYSALLIKEKTHELENNDLCLLKALIKNLPAFNVVHLAYFCLFVIYLAGVNISVVTTLRCAYASHGRRLCGRNWLEHSYVIGEDNLHFNVVLFL